MEQWLTAWKFPLGEGMKVIIAYLKTNAAGFFDAISVSLEFLIEGITGILLAFPAVVLIALIAALAQWLHRSWRLSLFVALALLFVVNLGYWKPTVETLALVGSATLVSVVIGVPIGIACLRNPDGARVAMTSA
eukprot:gene44202-58964_t